MKHVENVDSSLSSDLQNAFNIIIDDLENEKVTEGLLKTVFRSEKYLEVGDLISFLKERFDNYKDELDNNQRELVEKAIDAIGDPDYQSCFFDMLIKKLSEVDDAVEVARLDCITFWRFYPIAIKKCLKSPQLVYKKEDYMNYIKEKYGDSLTQEQIFRHEMCITAFNYDSNDFSKKDYPQLSLFLHPIRASKKIRVKKKHVRRVLHKSIKLSIAHRILHRERGDKVFENKAYTVPEQFAEAIIKKFLS